LTVLRIVVIVIRVASRNHDSRVSRFSVSLPGQLLEDLDEMVRQRGFENRSQGIASLVRDGLVDHRQKLGNQEIAGTVTIVYDHHHSDVQSVLTERQHHHFHDVISTMHVHLDHDNCLEVIVVRGKAKIVKELADALISAKGVKHGKLTVTTIGKDLAI
jgi:CopG family nickel-responsive transcriptional regulator